MKHGGPRTYADYGCRCLACTEAHRLRCIDDRAVLAARAANGDPAVPHGTHSGYTNWGCRCGPCRAAHRVTDARSRAARKLREGLPLSDLSDLERRAWEAAYPSLAGVS